MKEYFKDKFNDWFFIGQTVGLCIVDIILLFTFLYKFDYKTLVMLFLMNFLYLLLCYIDYKINKHKDYN